METNDVSSADLSVRVGSVVDALRPSLIAMLQEFVREPSLTGSEAAAQQLAVRAMAARGLAVDIWTPDAGELAPFHEHVGIFETLEGRPNVVGTWRGAGGGRSLILNAHIDTVETGNPESWTWPPFSGEYVDGKIYGRGACDMKAGLVTHLIAIEALQQLGFRPAGNLHVESVISEEDGGAGTLATILRGYTADGAIITEPTDLAVIAAQGGSLVFRLRVSGESAHACVRDEGVSAIEKYMLLHQAMLDFEAQRNATISHPLYADISNKIPINVGTLRSGSWPSSVPEWLEAEGRVGLVPGESLDELRKQFVQMIRDAANHDPWLREHPPEITWFSGQFAPAEITMPSPLVDAIRLAHQAVTGVLPAIEGVTYGADMRHFLHIGNTPCLMYGAGDVRLAHHTDEHISIDDVVTATNTIALTIVEWCGGTFHSV